MTDPDRFEMAQTQVHKLKDFYIHSAVYVLVNVGLIAVNFINDPGRLWFYWVLGGWGIGLLFHALSVYGRNLGKDWEEIKINEIIEREQRTEQTTRI